MSRTCYCKVRLRRGLVASEWLCCAAVWGTMDSPCCVWEWVPVLLSTCRTYTKLAQEPLLGASGKDPKPHFTTSSSTPMQHALSLVSAEVHRTRTRTRTHRDTQTHPRTRTQSGSREGHAAHAAHHGAHRHAAHHVAHRHAAHATKRHHTTAHESRIHRLLLLLRLRLGRLTRHGWNAGGP
jgi:hypothetical protein